MTIEEAIIFTVEEIDAVIAEEIAGLTKTVDDTGKACGREGFVLCDEHCTVRYTKCANQHGNKKCAYSDAWNRRRLLQDKPHVARFEAIKILKQRAYEASIGTLPAVLLEGAK